MPTAETAGNDAFEPALEVLSARVPDDQPNLVVLETGELAPGQTYVVHVSHVVSNDEVPLDPHHATGAFTTAPVPRTAATPGA